MLDLSRSCGKTHDDAQVSSCPTGTGSRATSLGFRVCPTAPGVLTGFFLSVHFRERDTTGQLIGDIDEVIAIVTELVNGTIDWPEACRRLPAYDGVQALE